MLPNLSLNGFLKFLYCQNFMSETSLVPERFQHFTQEFRCWSLEFALFSVEKKKDQVLFREWCFFLLCLLELRFKYKCCCRFADSRRRVMTLWKGKFSLTFFFQKFILLGSERDHTVQSKNSC